MGIESTEYNEKIPEKSMTDDFDQADYSQNLTSLQNKVSEERKAQKEQADELIQQELSDEYQMDNEATELDDKKVEEFVKKNCCEPIKNVNKIIPSIELVEILKKSAEKKNLPEVKKSIEEGNAKDQRIFKLPAYKKLVRKGFILPSDIRTYYDSANREPVYHLGVDYNVKAGKKVKAIYDGKVVESGLDGGLGHKVILEHKMPDGTKFYSLYGHLGAKHLPKVGDTIKKGKKVGLVGKAFTEENGNWQEHLHFQIMQDQNSPKGYSKIKGEGNYDVLHSFGKKID